MVTGALIGPEAGSCLLGRVFDIAVDNEIGAVHAIVPGCFSHPWAIKIFSQAEEYAEVLIQTVSVRVCVVGYAVDGI
jgi:hypothetical protein